MYYRKYFSGSVDATTTTTQYYMGLDKVATSTSLRTGHIKNRSDVIGNALVSTLRDIGFPNAYWDSTSGYLFFDKTNSLCGIYISILYSQAYFCGGYHSTTAYLLASNSSPWGGYYNLTTANNPFSATGQNTADYGFYITVKGEPKGVLKVNIGSYSNTSLETGYGFIICNGTDKKNNEKIFGYYIIEPMSSNSVTNFGLTYYDSADFIANTTLLSGTGNLALKDEEIVIIPCFFLYGRYFLDNTYINPGITNKLGFYEIDGEIYEVEAYYMIKCITKL